MKPEEREAARRLRLEGRSVKEIARELNVAKSSVSVWVRDLPLTDEQHDALKQRHPYYAGVHEGSKTNRRKHLAFRQQYQEEGRQKAREGDPLHIAGCMLYWAEGAKDRNMLTFINSDAGMIRYYMRFLRESLLVNEEAIAVNVMCYLGQGFALNEIEDYWLDIVQLPRSSLRKSIVNVKPTSSQQMGRKLIYGMCKVGVNRTRIVQHVYGAIQEYAGIDKPEWLD